MSTKPLHLRLGEPRFEPLTEEREKQLAAEWKTADKKRKQAIKEELVERHLRLVLHIGKGYEKRLTTEDIFATGALALTQAVERWQPDRGSIFGYARRYITTALTKAVDAQRTIKVPEAVANEAALVAIRIAELEAVAGRKFSQAERAAIAGDTRTFEQLPTVGASLDEPLREDRPQTDPTQPTTYEELIADESMPAPDEQLLHDERAALLAKALDELDDVERAVVLSRFGFEGVERETLSKLGRRYGVSAEAMRRIETSALSKLRHPALRHPLDGLL